MKPANCALVSFNVNCMATLLLSGTRLEPHARAYHSINRFFCLGRGLSARHAFLYA